MTDSHSADVDAGKNTSAAFPFSTTRHRFQKLTTSDEWAGTRYIYPAYAMLDAIKKAAAVTKALPKKRKEIIL